jgi:hypothetical protein
MGESGAQATGQDPGTSPGLWMFKQNGMVFGPVSARVILDKLYQGEINADTEVSREEEERFRSIREVAFFTLHLAKAQAKLKVEHEEDTLEAGQKRGRRTRIVAGGVLAVSIVGLAAFGAYWGVQRRQHQLEKEVDDIPITPNPPELEAASRVASRDVDVRLPTGPAAAPGPGRHPGRHGPVPSAAAAANDVTTAQYDKGSIVGAEVRQKGTLIPCIRAELRRTPDFRGDVRFSVAIGNDGHVAKLWMDDNRFKDGPLQSCFQATMDKWHFASYEGERATLSDSFHVGH